MRRLAHSCYRQGSAHSSQFASGAGRHRRCYGGSLLLGPAAVAGGGARDTSRDPYLSVPPSGAWFPDHCRDRGDRAPAVECVHMGDVPLAIIRPPRVRTTRSSMGGAPAGRGARRRPHRLVTPRRSPEGSTGHRHHQAAAAGARRAPPFSSRPPSVTQKGSPHGPQRSSSRSRATRIHSSAVVPAREHAAQVHGSVHLPSATACRRVPRVRTGIDPSPPL